LWSSIDDPRRTNCLQPGPRDAEETLKQLIRVIDDRELYEAIVALL
jgi:hypothetical protein